MADKVSVLTKFMHMFIGYKFNQSPLLVLTDIHNGYPVAPKTATNVSRGFGGSHAEKRAAKPLNFKQNRSAKCKQSSMNQSVVGGNRLVGKNNNSTGQTKLKRFQEKPTVKAQTLHSGQDLCGAGVK